jgi:PAS domain S-box-containing protein
MGGGVAMANNKRISEESIKDKVFSLASILESVDDAVITKDSKGIITSWNSGAEKIYGFSAKKAIGQPISILILPGHTDEAPDNLERLKRGESVHHYETIRRRKDGQTVHVSVGISAVKDKNGQIIGAATIARDITADVMARKQAEEKLAAAYKYARSLIESSPDPLATISAEGKITDVNEATIKITGIPRQDLIGTDFSDYFTEPDKASKVYQQVFAKGIVTDYLLTIRHKNGRLTDVLYNASVYKDPGGHVIGVFAAARDVTAQKQAEAEVAQRLSKELERLAELERFRKLTVGRELKMIELKKEIEELKKEMGERYDQTQPDKEPMAVLGK